MPLRRAILWTLLNRSRNFTPTTPPVRPATRSCTGCAATTRTLRRTGINVQDSTVKTSAFFVHEFAGGRYIEEITSVWAASARTADSARRRVSMVTKRGRQRFIPGRAFLLVSAHQLPDAQYLVQQTTPAWRVRSSCRITSAPPSASASIPKLYNARTRPSSSSAYEAYREPRASPTTRTGGTAFRRTGPVYVHSDHGRPPVT